MGQADIKWPQLSNEFDFHQMNFPMGGESKDPAFQKDKILEELKPDLQRIREGTKNRRSNLQEAINFTFTNYPPPPLADGSKRTTPSVEKLGDAKAVRKMIVSYHPDKIDKSDPKKKLLCEEITKV